MEFFEKALLVLIPVIPTIITITVEIHKTRKCMEVNDHKTYLLLLLSNYPEKEDEIYSVARHYFSDLKGDSFVLPLFEEWVTDKGAALPEWFLQAKAIHPKGGQMR